MSICKSSTPARREIAGMVQSAKLPRVILRFIRACLGRVFNLPFLASLSLLLGIGLGCLWLRSMGGDEGIRYVRSSGQTMYFGAVPRGLEFYLDTARGTTRTPVRGWQYSSRHWKPGEVDHYLTVSSSNEWLGFIADSYEVRNLGGGYHVVSGRIPLWFPMLLTLIAPLCWLRRWRRQARRVRLGLCLHCGYDLRATPAPTGPRLPRCPECGRDA